MQPVLSMQVASIRNIAVFGGEADMVRDLERHLKPFGLEIIKHVSVEHMSQFTLPKNADACIIMSEMVNHSTSDKVMKAARQYGIPFAAITRKWATAEQQLRRVGIIPKTALPLSTAQLKVIEGADSQQDSQEKEKTMAKDSQQQQQKVQGKFNLGSPTLPAEVASAVRLLGEEMRKTHGTVDRVVQLTLEMAADGQVAVSYTILAPTVGTMTL